MARAYLHESVGVLNIIFVWAGLTFVSPSWLLVGRSDSYCKYDDIEIN